MAQSSRKRSLLSVVGVVGVFSTNAASAALFAGCGDCTGPTEECVANTNNLAPPGDSECAPCSAGETSWPCGEDGLCWCWDTTEPKVPPAPSSGLTASTSSPCSLFSEALFNFLAPQAVAPYTYLGLCQAIDDYNALHVEKFAQMGSRDQRKGELAAFIGHAMHESDGFTKTREDLACGDHKVVDGKTYCKPCRDADFDRATKTCSSSILDNGQAYDLYCNLGAASPPVGCSCSANVMEVEAFGDLAGYMDADSVYFGRGVLQLEWNYLYIKASTALTASPDIFCNNPDLIATDVRYAWGAGIYFWMENIRGGSTSHIEVLQGDFGGTLNNINSGLCPTQPGSADRMALKVRLNGYCLAAFALQAPSILSFDGCDGMFEAYTECRGDGTCPNCNRWPAVVTSSPTATPTMPPPSRTPTSSPTMTPTASIAPSAGTSEAPSASPTNTPTKSPSRAPTKSPVTAEPTRSPVATATLAPSVGPCSGDPCQQIGEEAYCRSQYGFCGPGASYCNDGAIWSPECVTGSPTGNPTKAPTSAPTTLSPTDAPNVSTSSPTKVPTNVEVPITSSPTKKPTSATAEPTERPATPAPTLSPMINATALPTSSPSVTPCSGDPCNMGYCRSEHGYCGPGDSYCNGGSSWTPACIGSGAPSAPPTMAPSTKAPSAPSMSTPTQAPVVLSNNSTGIGSNSTHSPTAHPTTRAPSPGPTVSREPTKAPVVPWWTIAWNDDNNDNINGVARSVGRPCAGILFAAVLALCFNHI